MATANCDPTVFADPDAFDITREPAGQPQLTFGSGIHYCLGAALARAELQEALPILARRMPDLALDGDDHVEAERRRHLRPRAPPRDASPPATDARSVQRPPAGGRIRGSRDGAGRKGAPVDFELPADLKDFLDKIDDFIEREIKPLEQENDNIRFLDHRREDARTDWERGGLPNKEWEELMREARRRADVAGIYRYVFPERLGGMDGTNLGMAVIREHLAAKGLGLHCDLQTEHTIVGNPSASC